MKCGHLFNGIAGFPLAASWMGWENIMHCEIDPFCNRVMNYHFPNSFQHEDIRTTDFTIWRGKIDLLTGGFPCQPYSTAGKRKGTADDRHLWPEMLRAIREISPRWIVGENVRGLTNWNGGLVFDQVQADMEVAGYEVIPFLLPAAGVGAPHRRDRIWFVAHAKICHRNVSVGRKDGQQEMDFVGDGAKGVIADALGSGHAGRQTSSQGQQHDGWRETRCVIASPGGAWNVTDTNGGGLPQRDDEQNSWESQSIFERFGGPADWQNFPTQSPVCNGDDGFPGGLAVITVPSRKYGQRILTGKQAYGRWRKESLKALGNAICPQVAFEIFKAIEQYESPARSPGEEL